MNILGISGSSRNKHTNYMLKTVLDATGLNCDLIKLKDLNIKPCANCKSCHKTFRCVLDDDMQSIYPKLLKADIIILASPTYFDNVSGIMKNFMDRCLPFYFSEELKNKKVVVLAMAGFKSQIEYDEEGNCLWCKDGNQCEESVANCLKCLKVFSHHLGMSVIKEMSVIHGNPTIKEQELIELGKSLIK